MAHVIRLTQHVTRDVMRPTSRLFVQVQSAGKRRQQTSRNTKAEAGSEGAFGSLLFREAESGDADHENHPWSWVRDYQRPPSRQLPPEMALFLDNHPDDVNASRQPSPHNCSDAGVSLLYPSCFFLHIYVYYFYLWSTYKTLYQEARARQQAAAQPLLKPKMTKASGMCPPRALPLCAGFLNTI